MVAANGESEAAECSVRRDFDSGKVAMLIIRQAWQGRGSQGDSGF